MAKGQKASGEPWQQESRRRALLIHIPPSTLAWGLGEMHSHALETQGHRCSGLAGRRVLKLGQFTGSSTSCLHQQPVHAPAE